MRTFSFPSIRDPAPSPNWLRNGGDVPCCLMASAPEIVQDAFRRGLGRACRGGPAVQGRIAPLSPSFFQGLQLSFAALAIIILLHAGVRPNVPLESQKRRGPDLDQSRVSELDRGFRSHRGSWPYASPLPASTVQQDRAGYLRVPNRQAHCSRVRRRAALVPIDVGPVEGSLSPRARLQCPEAFR